MSDGNKLEHLAIIMDGNRRWAKEKSMMTTMGHKRGADVLVDIAKYCNEIGLKYFVSIETAVLTPKTAPAREKTNSFETISTLTFLAFQNLKALAKVERKAESLLVPKAM